MGAIMIVIQVKWKVVNPSQFELTEEVCIIFFDFAAVNHLVIIIWKRKCVLLTVKVHLNSTMYM